MQGASALLVGPAFSPVRGGLEMALHDLAGELRARGWRVDLSMHATTAMPSRLVPLQRWQAVMRFRDAIPARVRRRVASWFMPRRHFETASNNLRQLDAALADPSAYDVVLVCVDCLPTGTARLAIDRHERCVLLSLQQLAWELQQPEDAWLHRLARVRTGGPVHPYLFRPVRPEDVRLAIFASRDWRDDAVRAGLPARAARTIYYGVPFLPAVPRPSRPASRLLWVGRLSPEKGLTFLLTAMAAVRARCHDARLTMVASDGPAPYRDQIVALTRRLGLEEVVEIRSAVPREALPGIYADHDILLFYSPFRDPVALVLMEAFAAGLPVVSSAAPAAARLVQDGVTCLTYEPGDVTSLVSAVERLRADGELGPRLGAAASELVRREFSLEAMGRAYDDLLRDFVASGRPIGSEGAAEGLGPRETFGPVQA
jgi:glycosyltransferase involved in cell wall biosynthesis